MIGLIILFGVMIWFSSRRRKMAQTQVAQMHDGLRPGQRVRTVGGVVGRIKEIREESPGFKTVLLETGNAKNPAFMLFDIQAIYGIVPEEGHTIQGTPITTSHDQPNASNESQPNPDSDLNAAEYVSKRNNLSATKSKQTKRKQ